MILRTNHQYPAPELRVQGDSWCGRVLGRWSRGGRATRGSQAVHRHRRCSGTSLEEVVMSIAIAAISMGGISTGYLVSSQRAEWAGRSQAANSLALQRLEQVRAAKWDVLAYPAVDEVASSNFPLVVQALDMPMTGSSIDYATNVTTITTVSVDPPIKLVRSECIWGFMSRGLFTNSITIYRRPDQ